MHENGHFLSYRKRRHDAENHVHICVLHHSEESLQNGQQPQGNRLGKNSSSNLQGRSSDAFVGSWAFVYFLLVVSSFSSLVRCVAFFVLFTLAFTTGQTSSGSLPFIGCFIFPDLSLFVSSYVKMEKVLFVLVQQTSDFVASLGQVLGLGQLPVLAIYCFFSWLALLFLKLYCSFTMYK